MPAPAFGGLLKTLRSSRRVSQLQLSLDAEVSTRHLSFLETGRASPSREMVLVLGSALELSLRDRNLLLEAAGFTPAYRETAIGAPEMAELRHALELILRAHEPFPALVLDRHWDVVTANRGFCRTAELLLGKTVATPYLLMQGPARPNLVRTLAFDLKPVVKNWVDVMHDLIPRLARDAANDEVVGTLLAELRALPELDAPAATLPRAPLVLPVELALGEATVRLFTTITTLGTAQDVTTQELRIEALHAADDASRALLEPLLAAR